MVSERAIRKFKYSFSIKKGFRRKSELFFPPVETTRKSVQNYPAPWSEISHILLRDGDRTPVFSPGNQKLPPNPDDPIPWERWKNN